MLILNSVQPEKWYSVNEVSDILGWSVDVVRRWIIRGLLKAFIQPAIGNRRKRVYRSARVQGAEIIRFVKTHMNQN
jgi:DNA-binding transcriptional MerR regulator